MDKINPDHYKTGGIETIDYIEAKLTGEQFKGYLVGNVIKYLSRFEHKAGEEDLQKARWYLNRLLVQRKRPVIYVCSPLRGDIERNIHKAIGYSRYIYSQGGIPLAPHVILALTALSRASCPASLFSNTFITSSSIVPLATR
jgi:hypothetical protein